MQKRDGLDLKIASSNAMAVMAFSPPEAVIDTRLLAGRLGLDLDARVQHVDVAVLVGHHVDVAAAAEQLPERALWTCEAFLDGLECLLKRSC